MILQNNGISMVTIDPIHPPNCLYPLQHIVIFLLQRRPPSSANGLHEHRISSSRLQPWTTQWNNGRMICCKKFLIAFPTVLFQVCNEKNSQLDEQVSGHFDTKNGEEEMEKHPACYDTLCLNQIPTYLDHIPEGTSTRPFVHYAQLYMSGEYDN